MFLAGFLGIHCIFIYVELQHRITWMESAIWLQKVIWQFIFRAALLPAACFKLNLWHEGIHHFNCMLLFGQAQICFIFFSFLLCFFLLPTPFLIHHFIKPKIFAQTEGPFYSQQAFNTEIFGIAYLISNLSIAEMLGWVFLFAIQVT